MPRPVRLPEPEQRAVYRILNFALRAGAVMLASGAGTVEVEATILAITDACGLQAVEVDVTFTSLTASFIRGDDVEPVTTLQVVRHRSVDYGRLAAASRMADDLVHGRIAPDQAMARLGEIQATPPRQGWRVLLGWAGMAAAFTVLLGGGPLVAVTGFVSTTAVYLANRNLARRGVPDFFLSAVGAAVATGLALVLVTTGAPATSSLVVAGGIMVLVPGYALVASVQDALTGFPISAGARGLEVVMTAAGIVTGVAVVLYAASAAGVTMAVVAPTFGTLGDVPAQVVAAGIAAALYGAATNVPRGFLAAAGLTGALGWGAFLGLEHGGASTIAATAVAALVVGFTGQILAARLQTHPFLFIVPGVMPLVPGLTIYQGMLALVYGQPGGSPTLLRALAAGLAIAAGVILGNVLLGPMMRVRHAHPGAPGIAPPPEDPVTPPPVDGSGPPRAESGEGNEHEAPESGPESSATVHPGPS